MRCQLSPVTNCKKELTHKNRNGITIRNKDGKIKRHLLVCYDCFMLFAKGAPA